MAGVHFLERGGLGVGREDVQLVPPHEWSLLILSTTKLGMTRLRRSRNLRSPAIEYVEALQPLLLLCFQDEAIPLWAGGRPGDFVGKSPNPSTQSRNRCQEHIPIQHRRTTNPVQHP